MASVDISRQIRVPMDDEFRPMAGDVTYNALLSDKPFVDDRQNYRYLSNYYQKSDPDEVAGTFAEHRAANNYSKMASLYTPMGILGGGLTGYLASKAIHPLIQAHLSGVSPVAGSVERMAYKYIPNYRSRIQNLPLTHALYGAGAGGVLGMGADFYNYLNQQYTDNYAY